MRHAPKLGLALAVVGALASTPAQAQPHTRCTFEGPVPGFRALRVDLPEGSDFLTMELQGARGTRPLNDENGWHLAQGLAVIDAGTREIVSHQVQYAGTAAPVVTAEVDGERVVRQGVHAPDGPWVHGARATRNSLAPGSYYIVAFGTGGPSSGARAQRWGASVYLEGTHRCIAPVAGEVFDFDHTEFSGGTQAYVPGAGVGEDLELEFTVERPLVFGLIDVGYQGGDSGEATLDFELPTRSGALQREIVPFVSTHGAHAFAASYRAAYPIIGVAGVALDLPRS